MYKVCKTCKEIKDIDHFYKSYKTEDGYQSNCKICAANRKRKCIHVLNEKLLCSKCKLYKIDKEFDINNDCWYRKERDFRCKKCKDEQRKERSTEYSNIDKLLSNRFLAVKDRIKKNNLEVEINKDYLLYLWEKQDKKCAISGIEMTAYFFKGRIPTNVSVDRKDSNKGYTKENTQLVCMAVNQMKSDLKIEELIDFCEKIVKNNTKYSIY